MCTHDVRFAASYTGHYWACVNMHVPVMCLSLPHFGSESIRKSIPALYICFITAGASLARRSACSRWKQTSTQPSVHVYITMFVFSYFASRQDGGLLRRLLSEYLAALQSPTYTESFKQSLPHDSFSSCFSQSSHECVFPCGSIILNIQLNILLQTQAVMSHVRVSRGTGLCLELPGGCKRSAAALAGQHRGSSVALRGRGAAGACGVNKYTVEREKKCV